MVENSGATYADQLSDSEISGSTTLVPKHIISLEVLKC